MLAFFETIDGTVIFSLMISVVLAVLVFSFSLAVRHAFFSSPRHSAEMLYVRAVMPDYAERSLGIQGYSLWYVGHEIDSMTSNYSLQLLRREYEQDNYDEPGTGIEDFMDWLANEKGFVVFHSGGHGNDGVAIIACEEYDPYAEEE